MRQGLVVDASIILDVLLNGVPDETLAHIVEHPFHAPTLIDYEIASGLRKHARLAPAAHESSTLALHVFRELDIERHDAHPLLVRMWSLRETITSYDASYVALAEALDIPLATSDLRLARAAGPYCEVITPA